MTRHSARVVLLLLSAGVVAATTGVTPASTQDGPDNPSSERHSNAKQAYLAARESLREEFFDPFATAGLREEIGWDETDERAGAVLDALKKEVTSRPGYYDQPWEATWFLSVRDSIAETDLFEFLRQMPKGAILHTHPPAMGDYESLLAEAAGHIEGAKRFFVSELFRDCGADTLFRFTETPPDGYLPLADAWADEALRRKVLSTLVLTVEDQDHPGDIWELFQPIFRRAGSLMRIPELKDHYYRSAFEFLVHEDHVSHVELRMTWDPENEDTPGSNEHVILRALDGLDLSMKAIWSDSRHVHRPWPTHITRDVVKVGRILSEHPNGHLIGFDLVGEEDTGQTTLFALDSLLIAHETLGHPLPPLFFHDGESDLPPDYAGNVDEFDGTPSEVGFNNNLVDAYLMNTLALPDFTFKTARVGHGLALFKTPALARSFREAEICVELCPVSNQLLRYVPDIREHPGQAYLAGGIPVSLNPDDPAIYGYQGVTHDFWAACIAWDLDLLALKVLAYYSLEYSGLGDAEKTKAIEEWLVTWAAFAERAAAG